jgi:hypothetical protein
VPNTIKIYTTKIKVSENPRGPNEGFEVYNNLERKKPFVGHFVMMVLRI